MNHVRPTMPLRPVRSAFRNRTTQTLSRRRYATEQPPPPPPNPSQSPKEPSRVGAFYKSFGSPLIKCYMGALFVYQVTYWGWLKLETLEEKKNNDDEIAKLKEELKTAVVQQKDKTRGLLEQGKEAVESKVEEGKKKGWLSW
ncbi:hypothetical protein BS50DRAFT_62297 [Corynespora cassiicola Philippines]|uniref:Uncharacterized protein n=1 Tax=Corynespora cassiicola Philippines TaxID=1448308 RepID=A0A2T2NK10_CORCC|nr:hypothetical protein BS50DRAFT_62297 [Corynespora cassiicola Philippines]